MKRLFLSLAIATMLSGCQRACNKIERDVQTTSRHYKITVYSGGQAVGHFEFDGILNNQDKSDGYYWFEDGTLYEISGTCVIESK